MTNKPTGFMRISDYVSRLQAELTKANKFHKAKVVWREEKSNDGIILNATRTGQHGEGYVKISTDSPYVTTALKGNLQDIFREAYHKNIGNSKFFSDFYIADDGYTPPYEYTDFDGTPIWLNTAKDLQEARTRKLLWEGGLTKESLYNLKDRILQVQIVPGVYSEVYEREGFPDIKVEAATVFRKVRDIIVTNSVHNFGVALLIEFEEKIFITTKEANNEFKKTLRRSMTFCGFNLNTERPERYAPQMIMPFEQLDVRRCDTYEVAIVLNTINGERIGNAP